MHDLSTLIDMVREHPMLGVGGALAIAFGYWLLQRKSRMQREADARLSSLRRDKADQYTKLRPPH